ncbi:MAG: hypothetical protein ACI311_01485 [Bacilli bacterium]
MKFKVNYYIPKEELLSLLQEAGFAKVDYIIPLYDATFHFVYKVRAENKTVILKIAKENSIVLQSEKEKLLNDFNATTLLQKETKINVCDIIYTNADYKEKKLETPRYVFTIYKYLVSSQVSTLKPSKEEKSNLEFSIGELIGDLSYIKNKQFGSPSLGFESSYCAGLTKMVDNLMQDEVKICGKNSKYSLFLKKVIDQVQHILLLVKGNYANLFLDTTNIFYLNKNESLTILNQGDYFYGDFLANFVSINPLEKLENKTYLIQGFNNTARNLLNVESEEIKIRYYILLLYKGILLNVKRHISYNALSIKNFKQKALAKAIMIFASHELSVLLKIELPTKEVKEEQEEEKDMLDAFEDLLDADKRAKNKKRKVEEENDSLVEENE